jgi:translation initiation factor 3 subunit L
MKHGIRLLPPLLLSFAAKFPESLLFDIMSSDPDACVPKVLTDFIFDLYDSVTLSQVAEEQTKLYQIDLADLNARYFSSSPWPSPQSIASECNGHPLFLALYRELTHRQYHAVSRPSVRDRCEGWHVYRELFEEIIEQEQEGEGEGFYVVPTWCFDILNEFVYQFQGFCQVRSAVLASARKHGLLQGGGGAAVATSTATAAAAPADPASPPETTTGAASATAGGGGSTNNGPSSTLLENLSVLQGTDAWDVESVFGYLRKLVQIGQMGGGGGGGSASDAAAKSKPVVYRYLGLFASVALSRLECLLGDYTSCLQSLHGPLVEYGSVVVESGPSESGSGTGTGAATANKTARDVVNGVLGARLSVAYHTGVSYLMLRRYKDAISTLAEMCSGFPHLVAAAVSAIGGGVGTLNPRNFHHHHHHRHDKNLDGVSNAALQLQSQLMKQYDRMICLLVVLTQLAPNALHTIADDATRRAIRDKLNKSESSAAAGASGGANSGAGGTLEDYFASPKFISVHSAVGAQQPAAASSFDSSPQASSSSLIASNVPFHRYQTILFLKEAQFQQPYKTLRSYLKLYTSLPLSKLAKFYDTTEDKVLPLLLSYKTRMRQLEATSTSPSSSSSSSSYGTAMDIHYYVVDSMCHIDEPEKQRRFETHFFGQLTQIAGIGKQAAAINASL